MIDELRIEKLAQYDGKRIKFRGTLDDWADWDESYGRVYSRACLTNVEKDGELIAHHVWVIRAEPLEVLEPKIGDTVELTGIVKAFPRKKDNGQIDYCVHCPEDVRVVSVPARTIPDPKPVVPKPAPAPPPTPPPAAAKSRDLLTAIRPAKDFLKVTDPGRALEVLRAAAALLDCAGGPDEAARVLQAVMD
jgi:hypothetical protein